MKLAIYRSDAGGYGAMLLHQYTRMQQETKLLNDYHRAKDPETKPFEPVEPVLVVDTEAFTDPSWSPDGKPFASVGGQPMGLARPPAPFGRYVREWTDLGGLEARFCADEYVHIRRKGEGLSLCCLTREGVEMLLRLFPAGEVGLVGGRGSR